MPATPNGFPCRWFENHSFLGTLNGRNGGAFYKSIDRRCVQCSALAGVVVCDFDARIVWSFL